MYVSTKNTASQQRSVLFIPQAVWRKAASVPALSRHFFPDVTDIQLNA